MNLFKILNFLNKHSLPSREKQEKIISKYNPKDDYSRSFCQYKCQTKTNKIISNFILNVASMFSLLKLKHRKNSNFSMEKYDNILVYVHEIENVPNEYRTNNLFLEELNCYYSNDKTKKIYKELKKKYFWHFYFRAKVYNKLLNYNYIINYYKPANIITSNEYSFTSSILTNYCEENNVMHIDVMHGEKMYDITNSFFRFSKLYVWSQNYIELFKKLKACITEYHEYLPYKRFHIDIEAKKEFDLTIYLQDQNSKQMRKLKNALELTKNLKIAVRPHPRYTNFNSFKKIFKNYYLENLSQITCEESIARTKCVCSIFSTVIMQAKCNNIDICIDDISSPSVYKKLNDLDYEHVKNNITLRDYIKKCSINYIK